MPPSKPAKPAKPLHKRYGKATVSEEATGPLSPEWEATLLERVEAMHAADARGEPVGVALSFDEMLAATAIRAAPRE